MQHTYVPSLPSCARSSNYPPSDGLFGPLIVHSPDEGHGHGHKAEHILTLNDEYVEVKGASELLGVYLAVSLRVILHHLSILPTL